MLQKWGVNAQSAPWGTISPVIKKSVYSDICDELNGHMIPIPPQDILRSWVRYKAQIFRSQNRKKLARAVATTRQIVSAGLTGSIHQVITDIILSRSAGPLT